ncbi:MAG: PASTA domain-containing protein [Iphinoe sp. HA4291-MV1]|jgi:beta-lactam-binding protein with PASTA domain|nr:PASTA domain-containing protein [Iphinoe sp. HA4291-MV1]
MNLAVQQLVNLTGKTRSEARTILINQGFQFKTCTKGGYETYEHLDGSVIHIRPNGEIVRTGPKIRGNNGKYYRRRYDQFGNQIQFIPGANTHSTGEIVIP